MLAWLKSFIWTPVPVPVTAPARVSAHEPEPCEKTRLVTSLQLQEGRNCLRPSPTVKREYKSDFERELEERVRRRVPERDVVHEEELARRPSSEDLVPERDEGALVPEEDRLREYLPIV